VLKLHLVDVHQIFDNRRALYPHHLRPKITRGALSAPGPGSGAGGQARGGRAPPPPAVAGAGSAPCQPGQPRAGSARGACGASARSLAVAARAGGRAGGRATESLHGPASGADGPASGADGPACRLTCMPESAASVDCSVASTAAPVAAMPPSATWGARPQSRHAPRQRERKRERKRENGKEIEKES